MQSQVVINECLDFQSDEQYGGMMKQVTAQLKIEYPATLRQELVETIHGVGVADPYRWLEEVDSEPVQEWIARQNRLTNAILEDIPAREAIRRRITELWNYAKFGVPFERGGRYFYTYNDGLQNQNVLCWMEALDAEPQVLLDPNRLSEDGTVALIDYAVSDDGQLLAYGLSASGSDWQEWRVREVHSGRDLDDRLQWVKFSGAAWTADGGGFFYSRYEPPAEGLAFKGANYHQKLYFHQLGTPQAGDRLVYERPDHKEWGFSGEVSEDGRYLVIHVWKGTHRENAVFYQDLRANGPVVVELLKDFDASYTFLANDGPLFYFLTDLDAPLSRVIGVDITQPERPAWKAILPQSTDALLAASLVHQRFIALYLHDAYSQVRVFDKAGGLVSEVDLPGMGTVTGFSGRQKDRYTFYHFSGFTTPGIVYRYDVETGASTVFRCPELGFKPQDYTTEQIFYTSRDGTPIPMFITYKKGLNPRANHPTYLYGYGGFNIPMPPAFSVGNLVWMERGGIFALANLRGGGEYGKPWHTAGMKLNKQNVFDDFIAAAEWLIAKGYTSTPRLAIAGRSNGGLLVGACLTQRPDLYGACLPSVGVLDMLRFHKFTIGWAWISDYGAPDDPDEFKALLAYSPYHNIQPGMAYPPTLIMTGDHDDRVFPAHSFKFAAALQDALCQAPTAAGPALIRIETKAGHGLGKPTAKLIEEVTDSLAFLEKYLDMEQPK